MTTIRHNPDLLDWMREIAPKMRKHTVLTKGRRCGGTSFAEEWVLDGVLAGYPCAWVCLTYKHVAEVWRDLVQGLRPIIRKINRQERRIECATGGLVDLWSSEADVSMRGRRYKRVVISESAFMPALKEIWEREVAPTLLDLDGEILFESSPNGHNYHAELHEKGQDPRFRDWASFQISTYANVHIPRAKIDNLREVMDESSFAQEILALFTSRSGVVFPRFDRDLHLLARDIMPNEKIGIGIDFGWHWFVAALAAFRGDEIYIFDELVKHQSGTRESLIDLAALMIPGTNRSVVDQLEIVAPDPSGEAENSRAAIDDVNACREIFGFGLVHKNFSARERVIEWGCARIRDLMLSASGRVRLRIHPRCRYLLRCIENYKYPDRKEGQPVADSPLKDGIHDHGIDALRYLVIQAICKQIGVVYA